MSTTKLPKYFMRYREIIREMRTDSAEFDRLDSADKWLAKYTYENLDKWPSKETLRTLLQRYPVAEPLKIYRGMNFSTKELWDEFFEKVSTGSLTFGGITSWGRNNQHVEQFAVTKPSYSLNLDTMRQYSQSQKEREYISGYRGVIIETIATPSNAIDVTKSGLGHEDEIILLPGSYKVNIFRELKKYQHAIDDVDMDDMVMKSHDGKYDSGFRDYILHHHTDKLGVKARRHLFLKCKEDAAKSGPIYEVRLTLNEPFSGIDRPGTRTKATMSMHYSYFYAGIEGQFLPEDNEICKKDARKVIATAVKIIKQHPECIFIYMTQFNHVAKYCGAENIFFDAIKQHIGAQYAEAERRGREINKTKFKDSWERDSAIRNHGEKVAEILSQMP